MNHIYRSIYNHTLGTWVAVSEIAKVHIGAGSRKVLARAIACALGLIATPALALDHNALPTDGTVTAGSGSISSSGSSMYIDQASHKLAIDWQSFNIGSSATVNFHQPGASAIALNRVIGSDKSKIYGRLNANGQVFLLNSNGILFGKSAEVNVGGLVASTLNLSNEDFLNGNYTFSGTAGSVINEGSLNGNYVALLGGQVSNSGTITARLGTVALAAGSNITIDFAGDGLINLEVNGGTTNALAENKQLIQADGGTIIMTAKAADSLVQSVVNNQGVIQARTIDTSGGTIKLLGIGENSVTKVAGTLDASAPNGGDGGFIETSAATVQVATDAKITTYAPKGKTGTWLIDPTDFTISGGSGAQTGSGIGADTLVSNLASTNVTLQTDNASGSDDGDINVNAAVSWSAATTLTLDAYADININADISATNGTLKLYYGQGSAGGSGSGYYINSGAQVNLSAGNHFYTKAGSAGAELGWTVITDLGAQGSTTGTDLQGIKGNLSGRYVLGADIDASPTSGWNSGAGFDPIGDEPTPFTGHLDGLGHVISDLTIDRSATNYVGLFGSTGSGATIANLGLEGGSVTGDDYVGGLVGGNYGTLSNSYATGVVTGNWDIGGLVGRNYGTLSNSYATVAVTGNTNIGGLVGGNGGTVYIISGNSIIISESSGGPISNSYATGLVSGNNHIGGLVGVNAGSGSISNSYATGAVSGSSSVGGLVGDNTNMWMGSVPGGSISNSYATGAVSGSSSVGGLVGSISDDITISNSFWDTDTSGQASGCGSITGSGSCDATGLTTAGMQTYANFNGAGWDISDSSGSSAVWRIYDGDTYPLLRSFLTSLTFTPDYDGSGTAMTDIAAYTVSGSYDASHVFGTAPTDVLILSSDADDTYTASLNDTYYSDQQGYDITDSRTVSTPGSSAGDIWLTNPITWTSGTLAINTSGTISASAAINGSGSAIFDLQSGTWNQINASLPTFSVYDFRLSGGSFIRALGGDGSGGSPYQLSDIYGVQGMDSSGMLGSYYALANAIDAAGTTNWNGGAGFDPIGDISTRFTGHLDGLEHVISDLTIDRSATYNVGLFGSTGSGATIANVGLEGESVTGMNYVGGLVGVNNGSSISNSYATGAVTGNNYVGGLVGFNDKGDVSNSYATGAVTGNGDYVGGLVGVNNSGAINNSYAAGAISGNNYVGGLMGGNGGTIIFESGPFISFGGGSISNSYATGAVSGSSAVGGLVGRSRNPMVGFLPGGTISNSYATGAVSGNNDVGGLVGVNNDDSTVSNSFWDTDTSGQASGCGSITGTGACNVTGLDTAGMQSYANFDGAGWDISASGGSSAIWRIYEGYTYPLLRSFLTLLTGTADSGSRVYDGTTDTALGVTWSTTPDGSLLFGTASVNSASANVGTHSVTPSGQYSNQQGYDIEYVAGSLEITVKTLTITGASADDKVYDGNTDATFSGYGSLSGLIGGETLTLETGGVSGSFGDKNVGTGKSVTATGYAISDGTGLASNYSLGVGTATTTADITPATLTVTGTTSADNKVYDSTTDASVSGGSLAGVISGDMVDLAQSGNFDNKNVGSGKTVTYFSSISGSGAGNYTLSGGGGTTTADITPATLTVTGTTSADNKVYDGTTDASVSGGSLAGVISGDMVDLAQSGNFDNKNVGSGKTVTYFSSISGSGAGNYTLSGGGGTTTADITPASLVVTANGDNKSYDGVAYSGGNGVSYSGFASGDDSSVLTGSLTYGGSSQGAIGFGSYSITPGGLAATNYTLGFADGILHIRPDIPYQVALFSADNTGGDLLSRLWLEQDDERNGPKSDDGDLIQIVDGGIRLPNGL